MSTTVSKLLQITAPPQGDQIVNAPGKSGEGDFLNHLETATENSRAASSEDRRGDEPAGDLQAASSQSSGDREATREQLETDLTTGRTEKDEQESQEEVIDESGDILELSEAIVAYLPVSEQNTSSAVIEVSQDSGVIVTEIHASTDYLQEAGHSNLVSADQFAVSTHQTEMENPLGTGDHLFTKIEVEGEQATQSSDLAVQSASIDPQQAIGGTATLVSKNGTDATRESRQQSQLLDEVPLTAASAVKVNEETASSQRVSDRIPAGSLLPEETGAESTVLEGAGGKAEDGFSGLAESNLAKNLVQRDDGIEQQVTQAETSPEIADRHISAQEDPNSIVRPVALEEKAGTGETRQTGTADIDPEPVPTGDRVRFVQRVSRAFQAARPGSNEIQLKLSPPELGTLRMSITVEQGVVSAKVETETAAARSILLDNLPALRERLAEQEIRVEKFDVDVGRDGQQSDQQSQFTSQDRESEAGSGAALRRSATEASTIENLMNAPSPEQKQIVTDSSLDVSI